MFYPVENACGHVGKKKSPLLLKKAAIGKGALYKGYFLLEV